MSNGELAGEFVRRQLVPMPMPLDASIAELARAACLWEASAPKPGNVHPTASFVDMNYQHFVDSASIVGECFEGIETNLDEAKVGALVLKIVKSTRERVGINTNLGIALLIVPIGLAMSKSMTTGEYRNGPRNLRDLQGSLESVLRDLDSDDAQSVYRAILVANPGGLGQASEMDVHQAAPVSLLEAMKAAQDRDQIARQYTNNFETCFRMAERLLELRQLEVDWLDAIVRVHVESLALHGDSLIRRKNDGLVDGEVRRLARICLERNDQARSSGSDYLELDRYLRADGNRRNPGTTADLIAGGLLIAFWANASRE